MSQPDDVRRDSARFLILVMMLAASVWSGTPVLAIFSSYEMENVPIERVLGNLERQVSANPSDVKARLNLARVHAMAWAEKAETLQVAKASASFQSGNPDFGAYPGFKGIEVKKTTDPEALKLANAHLTRAIDQYTKVLELEPSNETALLGQAWCLEQAGDKVRAIAGYRRVLELAWPRESRGRPPLPGFRAVPTTTEVGGYLIPLLDPKKDAEEIATIKAHIAQVPVTPRPITPVVVPLRDGVRLDEVIDVRARVPFDADGSGLQRRWTWITPNAGWLVFDRHGTGRITSALQWFGSVTFWLFWDSGYDAMRALDDDGDGILRGRELDGLAIWRDLDGDGVADAGEVRPLSSWGIASLSCRHVVIDDDPELAAWSAAGVTFDDGRTRPTYDVLLYPR